MVTTKILLVLLFSSQLSPNVAADLSDDARSALDVLVGQIYSSARLISITGRNLWYAYTRDLQEVTEELSRNETEKFNLVLSNLTVFASNVVGGNDCIEPLYNSNIMVVNRAVAEDLLFSNLVDLAFREVQNTQSQYWALHTEWFNNCLQDQVNCDGTSRAVIAEVERLLPKLRRTPYEFFAEIHVLAYKVAVNLEAARTDIREFYNKAVERATTCIATKLTQAQDNIIPVADTSRVFNESVAQSYAVLIEIVQKTNVTARDTVFRHAMIISLQYLKDIEDDLAENSLVYSKAVNTINALVGEAQGLNVTIDCNLPNIDAIRSSTVERIFAEAEKLVYHIMKGQVEKAVDDINNAVKEVYSIGVEIDGCSESGECDYISKKIAAKKTEIPRRVLLLTLSSSARLQETVVAVRESSARAIRDAIEQAEIGILDLKTCIQFALQKINSN